MRYRIVAVGSLRRGFAKSGCDHYADRLGRYGQVERRSVREGKGPPERVAEDEADALLAQADGRIVALDERGERLTSKGLSVRIGNLEIRGTSRLSILIGGAAGLAPRVRDAAHEVWRLSDLTLAHELAQLVLLEQLYRAETIRAGHPYHREG